MWSDLRFIEVHFIDSPWRLELDSVAQERIVGVETLKNGLARVWIASAAHGGGPIGGFPDERVRAT